MHHTPMRALSLTTQCQRRAATIACLPELMRAKIAGDGATEDADAGVEDARVDPPAAYGPIGRTPSFPKGIAVRGPPLRWATVVCAVGPGGANCRAYTSFARPSDLVPTTIWESQSPVTC